MHNQPPITITQPNSLPESSKDPSKDVTVSLSDDDEKDHSLSPTAKHFGVVDTSDDAMPVAPKTTRKVFNIASSSDEEEENQDDDKNTSTSSSDPAQKTLDQLEDEMERKIEKYRFSPKTRRSMGVFQQPSDSDCSESDEELSNGAFNENEFKVRDGFSSTMVVPNGSHLLSVSTDKETEEEEDEDEDSLVLLEPKVPTIDVSDESPESSALIPPPPIAPTIKLEPKPRLSTLTQPKITTFAKVQVPREVYEEQRQKLDQLMTQVGQQENLYKTVGKTMFDGGQKLLSRINALREEVEEQRKSVARLEVAPGEIVNLSDRSVEMVPTTNTTTSRPAKSIDWNDLELMLGSEQPKYVGKQGLKTFENQKAVTMDTLKDIHGSLSTRPVDTVLLDSPRGLKVELMPHQRHALAFMRWRESQRPRGGLLADDMGLGKTLTMLSLVVSDMEERKKEGKEIEEEEEDEDDENEDEEEKNKKEAEKNKKKSGWSAKGRREQYPGGTLVVCPASLLQQWEGEVKSKLQRNTLEYLVYHGPKRDSRGRYLSEYDLVVTTYSIASVDRKSNTGLYRVKWRRIILDEGHAIRNHKSQMSMAACDLLGRRRWLLTGTPIHNKAMDMFAVLKFIRCRPFDDQVYFRKWIDNKTESGKERLNTLLKSVMLRRTKAELQLKGALQELPTKTLRVVPVQMDKDEMNIYQRVLFYSRTLFAQFLDQRAEKVADGMRSQQDPSKDPNSVYFKLHKRMAKMTKPKHKQQQEVKQHQILVVLLRLRQICCHPGLINAMLDDPELGGGESFNASSCGEEDSEHSEIDLLNQLERLAIAEGVDEGNASRGDDEEEEGDQQGSKRKERIMVATNPVFDFERPSSKMRAILETVEELLRTDDKIVIVSQWTSVLNVLERYTKQRQIPTTKLTGEVAVKDRGAIVEGFNERVGGPRIMFLSLSAGGVGLNLVASNHLFLVDLHWNPQLEQQAQDRIYRFGQSKPVTIYKFVTQDSIEQRIQTLQGHKLSLAEAVLTGSKNTSGSTLTIADLKMLFDM